MVGRQHGVVARRQLLALGLSAQSIQHRVEKGRLHRVARGVYVVGRPELSPQGRWMVAVLSGGEGTALSHRSAGALWGIVAEASGWIDVSIRAGSCRRRGLMVHLRSLDSHDIDEHEGIPVTSPARTLVDLATQLPRSELERAINEADKLDLIDPDTLREELEGYRGQRGVRRLREILDRRTFRLTDSELERRFLRLVDDARLPMPMTRQRLNGFRVDFYWPALGLVVETDGLRYHRTPAQQARDHLRDQAHVAAGLTALRFTHAQVRFEPGHVGAMLAPVVRRLERARARHKL